MSTPVVVVLAAGHARRFAGSKLTADLHGRPVVAHVLDAAVAGAPSSPIVVVVGGPWHDRVEAAVRSWAARNDHGSVSCVTSDRDNGLGSSLAVAARHVGPRDMVVLLGDQPRVHSQDVTAVVCALARGASAVRIRHPDGPGHPVGLGASVHDVACAADDDQGPRSVFTHSKAVVLEVDHPRPRDIDTPEDLSAVRARGPDQ